MVESSDKKSQQPPSMGGLAGSEAVENMVIPVGKNESSDYDLEDDERVDHDASDELAKQRDLLAAVAQQARKYHGIDFDEDEEHDDLMRRFYDEKIRLQQMQNGGLEFDQNANRMLQMQAERLAQSGMDPLQAVEMLETQMQLKAAASQQQMMMPPSCMMGPLPNNLDIDLNEVISPSQNFQTPSNDMNGFGQPGLNSSAGKVDLGQLQQVYQGQPGMDPTQNQLASQELSQPAQKQPLTWIQWFSQLEGHEFLLPVPANFLRNGFNISNLGELKLPKARLNQCRDLMMRSYGPTDFELQNEQFLALNSDTSDMYGLIHAKYIRSPEGLALVYGKYLQGAYGYCPRAFCDKQRVVPNALSDQLRQNRVKVYCTKCEEMYIPQGTNRLDGAYFSSSLAHVFFQTYAKVIILPPKVLYYEPQLFGFRIAGHRGSKYFKPTHGYITEVGEKNKQLELDMASGSQQAEANQQQGSAQALSRNKTRNNKSRHRGRKN